MPLEQRTEYRGQAFDIKRQKRIKQLGQNYLLPAALLFFCAIPFGWTGAAAPLIWLSLCAIERQRGWKRAVAYLITGLLMLVTAMGLLPGGERVELIPPYTDPTGNAVFASFNAGKAVIAIALVAFMLRLRQSTSLADAPYILVAVAVPVICGLALFGPSVKFSTTIVVAALINLLVVCISEEGFFRWVLQRGVQEGLGRWRWLAVPLVTAVFTFLHTGWAASATALSMVALAGFCYALLWHLRQNFWVCVLVHWGVNAMHLFLLPYPLPG